MLYELYLNKTAKTNKPISGPNLIQPQHLTGFLDNPD